MASENGHYRATDSVPAPTGNLLRQTVSVFSVDNRNGYSSSEKTLKYNETFIDFCAARMSHHT